MNNTERKICKIMSYVGCRAAEFAAFSFIGWVYEVLLGLAVYGEYSERGYLGVPLCPIYGITALVLAIFVNKNSALSAFTVSAAGSAVIELAASYIIDGVLGYPLWDYSDWPMNFQGRVSLPSSLIFGLLGLIYIYGVRPAAERIFGLDKQAS